MPVIQEKFEVSDETYKEFMSGDIKFPGLVAQYEKGSKHGGNIKEWIKPINQNPDESNKKEILIGIGIGLLAVATSFLGKKWWDKHRKKKEKEKAEKIQEVASTEPKEVKDFKEMLVRYVEAIRQGENDIDIINLLLDKLEKLKEQGYSDKIEILLPVSLLGDLLTYTKKIAKTNDFELDEIELNNSDNGVIKLQTYLKAQKRVFESAA